MPWTLSRHEGKLPACFIWPLERERAMGALEGVLVVHAVQPGAALLRALRTVTYVGV